MALAFARLGSEVTLIERADRVMSREDEDVSDVVAARLSQEGVTVHTGLRALRIEGEPADEPARPSSRRLLCEPAEVRIEFDRMLCALGREPNLQGLGLDALGVGVAPSGYLELDPYLRTRVPSILAVGDVTGLPQFTHAAGHMAWYAAINALFGRFRQFRVDWRVLPQVTYLDPEVARVGLNELEARAQGLAVEVTRFELSGLDRAIVDRAEQGFIKVLTAAGSDRIVGATIVAPRAGESIAEFALAMKHGLGLGKILNTIHAYPTYTDANRLAAGQWRRARLPQRALRWAAWLHRWERG
jgi:pyruvate/2-oxoglutarate dehydrogenase complex dihydrolipoamide dehydrogenase (E3) component